MLVSSGAVNRSVVAFQAEANFFDIREVTFLYDYYYELQNLASEGMSKSLSLPAFFYNNKK